MIVEALTKEVRRLKEANFISNAYIYHYKELLDSLKRDYEYACTCKESAEEERDRFKEELEALKKQLNIIKDILLTDGYQS